MSNEITLREPGVEIPQLTKREIFALHAMKSFIAAGHRDSAEYIARFSAIVADETIHHLERTKK